MTRIPPFDQPRPSELPSLDAPPPYLRALLRDEARRRRILLRAGGSGLVVASAMAYFSYQLQHLPFDVGATLHLQRIEHTLFRDLMHAISLAGYHPWSPLVVSGGCIAAGHWLGWQKGVFLLILVGIEGISNRLIKEAIGRPRPAEELVEVLFPHSGNSFPSGHVMLYVVFFGFLLFLIWTHMRHSRWRTTLLLTLVAIIAAVGPSRIYLGAHWLSDVIAGYLIGLLLLLVGIELYAHLLLDSPTPTHATL